MPRPMMLGIVGDSGSGKTTITRGLVRVLGDDQVTHFCTDDYHRYDRGSAPSGTSRRSIPDCNHLDILAQHLAPPAQRRADHEAASTSTSTARSGRPTTSCPGRFVVTEGLLGVLTTASCATCFDVRVYLDPPEELRRHWKVQRDCSRRGYTTDQVLSELDRREPDSEAFIRPQRHHADIVVSFQPGDARGPGAPRLQAHAARLAAAPRPHAASSATAATADRARRAAGRARSSTFPGGSTRSGRRRSRRRSGSACTSRGTCARSGSASSRSAPSCTAPTRSRLVQLLILYHLVTARAVVVARRRLGARLRRQLARRADRRGRALAALVARVLVGLTGPGVGVLARRRSVPPCSRSCVVWVVWRWSVRDREREERERELAGLRPSARPARGRGR